MSDVEFETSETSDLELDVEIENESAEAVAGSNESTNESAAGATKSEGKVKKRVARSKRKAETDLRIPTLKRQNSLPNLKLPASKMPATFSDMMLRSFEDEKFVTNFAPLITAMISPALEKAMEKAVDRAVEKFKVSVLDPVVQSNKDLQETIKKQTDIMESQRKKLEDQEKTLAEKSSEINSLKKDISSVRSELEKLQIQVNDAEQYGRRNSIRLSNFSYNVAATEEENITSMVKYINSKLLTEGEKITPSDIERCHPVGRRGPDGKGQMIVKFSNYLTKQRVYSAKSKLKNNLGRVFITEDLTKANHVIVQALIPLKKSNKIASFWTRNGTIFAKQSPDDRPVKLRSVSDVETYFG